MIQQRMTNSAGLSFCDPGFFQTGRLALKLVFSLPSSVRERLFFHTSAVCLPLQKLLRYSLGGAFTVHTRFTEGPLNSYQFECFSSEKYFILGSSFERDVQHALAALVQQNDTVYDVGAHIGYMALLFSALCGRGGRVFTFEPSPVNFPRLERNIKLNPKANITAINCAVSDKEFLACFLENGSMSSLTSGKVPSKNVTYVQTLRLDDFVYRDGVAPPSLVKIDTEGHAGLCLQGMRRILMEHRPAIMLEIHEETEAAYVSHILQECCYASEVIDAPAEFPRRVIAKPRKT